MAGDLHYTVPLVQPTSITTKGSGKLLVPIFPRVEGQVAPVRQNVPSKVLVPWQGAQHYRLRCPQNGTCKQQYCHLSLCVCGKVDSVSDNLNP